MIQQRKKPAQRLFTGIAGSPLARITVEETVNPATQVQVTVTALMNAVSQIDKDDTDKLKQAVGDFTSAPAAALVVDPNEIRKQKEAERGRERRKQKREQLAAIKEALKTPIAELLRQDRELDQRRRRVAQIERQMERDKNKLPSMNSGKSDKLVYGGGATNMDLIAGAALNVAALSAPDNPELDPTDPHSYWPDHDRRFVAPEGAGADSEERPIEFIVKEGTSLDRGQALLDLFHELCVWIAPDAEHDGYFVCRLCRADIASEPRCMDHLEEVHGKAGPKHDGRFGNVISKRTRLFKNIRRSRGRSNLLKTNETRCGTRIRGEGSTVPPS